MDEALYAGLHAGIVIILAQMGWRWIGDYIQGRKLDKFKHPDWH